jgi:serine/threonine protein kinase/formylglycine-generating enzyme required for sulfatase activity/dienelactone hydrolase
MNCAKCHYDNSEDSFFCKKCGTKLPFSDDVLLSQTKTIQTSPLIPDKGILIAGKYRITAEIGRGGMGIVYKVEDTKLRRNVALKFLPPELSRYPEAKERFIREAHAAAVLDHPHICTIFEVGEYEDKAYIAMAYVEGQSLREKIAGQPLPLDKALDIAIQIAEGLEEAHNKGIIHRDIKSANIMVTEKGQVKIMDFGLAKVAGESLITKEAKTMGTVAYMSPEQARGEAVDQRTDIWSLGVVLYEMLSGRLPFQGERETSIMYSIVHEEPKPLRAIKPDVPSELEHVIHRALEKKAELRYSSAQEMLKDLKKYQELSRAAEAGVLSLKSLWRRVRKPQVAVPTIVIILALVFLGVRFFSRQAKIRWAKDDLLPKINQLVEAGRDNFVDAYKLAEEAEKYIPHDPKLSEFLSKIAINISLQTEPEGAKIYLKEYKAPDSEWQYLGVSPIDKIRLPVGFFRWKIEKEGYETVLAAAPTFEMDLKVEKLYVPKNFLRRLDKTGSIPPGMVRVRGEKVAGLGDLGDFFMDRCEITNRQFKEFVDKGGYQKKEYWKQKFIKDGKELAREEALKEFVDQSGRPGPSTWQAGDYPRGQDDYPVSGVSWYEAAACAEFAGKSLPTLYHWGIARGFSSLLLTRGIYTLLAPFSNFKGEGPAIVGSFPGMTGYGALDMAGNVREWCWNEAPKGRIVRGGAWNDATYMFGNWSQASPFDRSPKNGFRCVLYPDPNKIPKPAFESAKPGEVPDFYKVTPVPDSVFQYYLEQFSYDKIDLKARVEWKNESSRDWVQEKIAFNAAYENERVIAYLFLPRNSPPPYQTVIYFPGSGSISQITSENLDQYWEFDVRLSVIVKNGRAVLYPIYKGTFERGDDVLSSADESSYLYTEWLVKMVKDFKRCIDYLETRPDIDSKKLAYFGFSWGGELGTIIPAAEDRLKASILAVGGLFGSGRPEANDLNYVTRVKIPTLMLNGKYDMAFPYETTVKPMFYLLGTPPGQKELKVYETDHFIPRNEFIKETLNWLDKYLGPVK